MDYSTRISERMWNQPDKGILEAERENTFIDDIVSSRLGALPYLSNPIQKNQFILDEDSKDAWVQWCISSREKMIEEFSFNKNTLWKSYKSGLLCDVEETKKAFENGEVPWSISYHFMPDELERILEKNGVKRFRWPVPAHLREPFPMKDLVSRELLM